MSKIIKLKNNFGFVWRLINEVWGNFGVREVIKFPSNIGGYEFVSTFMDNEEKIKFQFAVYRSKNNEEAIAKQISKKKSGLYEYWLRNEISVYRAFKEIYNNNEKEINSHFPNIKVPRLIDVVEDDYKIICLIEKIEGDSLENLPMSENIKNLDCIINYLSYINDIYDFGSLDIAKRRFWHLIPSLIIATLGAIKNYPSLIYPLLKSLFVIMINLPYILSKKERSFVHRDLGYSNLLMSTNKFIYIIDFELSCYIHPLWEVVHLYISNMHRDKFNESFAESDIMRKIYSDFDSKRLFRYFSLFAVIRLLSNHEDMGNPNRFHKYKDFLLENIQ